MAGLLGLGLPLGPAAALAALLCAALLLAAIPGLLRDTASPPGEHRLRPTPTVLLIGVLCFIAFMAEGAMLDWSAVFLHFARGVPAASAGLGYAGFSVAMAAGRLSGDAVIRRFGAPRVLAGSAALACVGLLLAVGLPGVDRGACRLRAGGLRCGECRAHPVQRRRAPAGRAGPCRPPGDQRDRLSRTARWPGDDRPAFRAGRAAGRARLGGGRDARGGGLQPGGAAGA